MDKIIEIFTTDDHTCVTPINKVNDNIYIGDHNAATSMTLLRNYGVTHVINCAAEIPDYYVHLLHYYRLNLLDQNDNLIPALKNGLGFIRKAIDNNKNAKIFIHCHMGRSRSASMVIYYLMMESNVTFDNALTYLKSVRPTVSPNDHYRNELSKLRKFN